MATEFEIQTRSIEISEGRMFFFFFLKMTYCSEASWSLTGIYDKRVNDDPVSLCRPQTADS